MKRMKFSPTHKSILFKEDQVMKQVDGKMVKGYELKVPDEKVQKYLDEGRVVRVKGQYGIRTLSSNTTE